MEVARLDGTLVAGKVLMVYGAGEEVCDSFLVMVNTGLVFWGFMMVTYLSAMRMIGESRAGGAGEVIQHEERTEVAKLWGADRAAHFGAYALRLLDSQKGLADCAGDRHSFWFWLAVYLGGRNDWEALKGCACSLSV